MLYLLYIVRCLLCMVYVVFVGGCSYLLVISELGVIVLVWCCVSYVGSVVVYECGFIVL